MYADIPVEDDFDENDDDAMDILKRRIRDGEGNNLMNNDYDDDSDSDHDWDYCYEDIEYQNLVEGNYTEPELRRTIPMPEDRFDSNRAPQWNSTDLSSKIGNDINKL